MNVNHTGIEEQVMTKIVVVGNGYVGSRIKAFFHGQPNIVVTVYDPNWANTDFHSLEEASLWKPDYAIVAVPTNMNEDGSCDT